MRKLLFTILVFMIVSFSALAEINTHEDSFDITTLKNLEEHEEKYRNDLRQYQELVEQSLVWRAKAIEYYQKVSTKDVLSNKDLLIIHNEGTTAYRNIRERLLALVQKFSWTMSRKVTLKLSEKETRVATRRSPTYTIHINPIDRLGTFYTKAIKMSLAAGLLMGDNYILAISRYSENEDLRKLIDSDHPEVGNYLKRITRNYNNPFTIKLLSKSLGIFEKERIWEKEEGNTIDKENEYFNEIIERSFLYSKERHAKKNMMMRIFGWAGFAKTSIEDHLSNVTSKLANEVSKVFGNSVGMIQTRNGKLFHMSKVEQEDITSQMRALDVLFEKTPFRLTDKFIPGHWGHVAIWSGNEEELKELGVWEKLPEIYDRAKGLFNYKGPSFQEAIRSGHYIIEALRPGVQISTLQHFLQVDDLGVIRHTSLSDEKKHDYLIHAFEQIGKEYDFNFDVETDKKIVCSELAYVVYNEMEWPTENTMGRNTISPDHVAEKVLSQGGPFEPVLIYHNGKKIEDSLSKNYDHLLNLEYDQVIFDN